MKNDNNLLLNTHISLLMDSKLNNRLVQLQYSNSYITDWFIKNKDNNNMIHNE